LEEAQERSLNRFVWMMIALPPYFWFAGSMMSTFAAFLSSSISKILPRLAAIESISPWMVAMSVFDAVGLLLLVLLAVGKPIRDVLRKSLRIPSPIYLFLAFLFPLVVHGVLPFFSYLHDRAHWAAFDWGRFSPPSAGSYFEWPSWQFTGLFLPALIEEIAWRGYLQPRFIERYGLYRGVFLVGVVWGAFHFGSDFHSRMALDQIFLMIVTRFLSTISHSFTLGWLTLRSKSILPAAMMHALSNVLIVSSQPLHSPPWLVLLLWTLLAYLLFRYWPPENVPPVYTADATLDRATAS
jgi:membrane protease YdiL (CAAX protease family)